MNKHTPLYEQHIGAGAKMVDFAGWDMPIHYGSQVQEHATVREDAGMFDVSHMTVVDITGSGARDYLRHLLANDVDKLTTPGKALYTCMLNDEAGVVDDLIVYDMGEGNYRLVVNAGTRDKDLAWLRQHVEDYLIEITERPEFVMLAVQGPNAREKVIALLPVDHQQSVSDLKPFQAGFVNDWFIARTGYTGEDGFEIMIPEAGAVAFWDKLLAAGVKPIGLGARDTLRLEAGYNLYGHDMDDDTTPLESNLAWTIAWEPSDRDFIGREPLEHQKAEGVDYILVGLVLEDRGVLRDGQKVIVPDLGEGIITSGSFSPTLKKSIAFARVPNGVGDTCFVDVRGKELKAKVVKPAFVRKGESLI